jgi:hypothetical protein
MFKHFPFLAIALIVSLTASAQTIKRIPLTASQNPTNADLPFSQAVWAGDTLYVSGWLDPDIKSHPDTTSQTVSLLKGRPRVPRIAKPIFERRRDDACVPRRRSSERRQGRCAARGPDILNSLVQKINRTNPHAPQCRWLCPLVLAAVW